MLEEFTAQSQFVVVTHSKRTMERANLLYGVTMPERGVSRRVAVRLEQMDAHGQITDMAALNARARSAAQAEPELEVEAAAADTKPVDATPDLPALESEILAEPAPAPRMLEAPAMARRSRKSKKTKDEAAD